MRGSIFHGKLVPGNGDLILNALNEQPNHEPRAPVQTPLQQVSDIFVMKSR